MTRSLLTCFLVWLLLLTPAHAIEVQEVKTRGGLTAWLVQDASLPALSVRLTFRQAGAAFDPPGKEGRATLAVSLLTEGAGERNAQEFQEALDFYAIRLGSDVGVDDVSFSLLTLSEHADRAFSLLRDALVTAHFSPEDVQRIRDEHLVALRLNKGESEVQAARALLESVFGTHPYGRPEEGTETSVTSLTVEELKDFPARHLRKGSVILSVAGDISPSRLKTLLEQTLDTLPEGTADVFSLSPVTPHLGTRTNRVMQQVPQSVVRFALPGVPRASEDYYTAFVLNQLLGGSTFASRMGKELREKDGLTYYAASDLSERDGAALLMGGFATRNEKVEESISRMHALIATLGREGFTQRELEDGVSYLTGAFPERLSSNASVVQYLGAMQRYALGRDYLDRRNALLRAVTLDQVNALARRILDPGKLSFAVAGEANTIQKGK